MLQKYNPDNQINTACTSSFQLYDLRTEFGGSEETEDGCTLEDCTACPSNSICVGDVNQGTPMCYCKPGFGGEDCDQGDLNILETNKTYIKIYL